MLDRYSMYKMLFPYFTTRQNSCLCRLQIRHGKLRRTSFAGAQKTLQLVFCLFEPKIFKYSLWLISQNPFIRKIYYNAVKLGKSLLSKCRSKSHLREMKKASRSILTWCQSVNAWLSCKSYQHLVESPHHICPNANLFPSVTHKSQ